ncbi:MAG TPA: hypothetical protein ENN88_03495 [Candidatus Coatesbacteria bacterium]|nr:hypothetical protein [Candidatus Coatesbacteria bacterium]
MRTAAALLTCISAFAWADVGAGAPVAYAYPTPWACGGGELTLHFESGEMLSSPPTFVIVDMAGVEVIRVRGELAVWRKDEEGGFIYEAAWDGRNADGRLVAPGTYICYVEGVRDTAFRFIVKR